MRTLPYAQDCQILEFCICKELSPMILQFFSLRWRNFYHTLFYHEQIFSHRFLSLLSQTFFCFALMISKYSKNFNVAIKVYRTRNDFTTSMILYYRNWLLQRSISCFPVHGSQFVCTDPGPQFVVTSPGTQFVFSCSSFYS